MTKKVRIENADGSDHKVVVQTWQKGVDGAPDVMLKEEPLRNPADMLDGWVWKGQYLVVVEKGETPPVAPEPTTCKTMHQVDQLGIDILKRLDGVKAEDAIETLQWVDSMVRKTSLQAPVSVCAVVASDLHLAQLLGPRIDTAQV